jgi:hypothetical protein
MKRREGRNRKEGKKKKKVRSDSRDYIQKRMILFQGDLSVQ